MSAWIGEFCSQCSELAVSRIDLFFVLDGRWDGRWETQWYWVGESLHSSLCMKPSLAKSGSGLDLWLYCNQPSCTFQSNDVVVILGKEYECHAGCEDILGNKLV